MRSLPAAIAARRAARAAIHAETLVWLSPRNRSTGAVVPVGFWTGVDHQTFTVAGQARDYFGAGAVLEVPSIEATSGLVVQTYEVKLSAIAPDAEAVLRGYDTRGAAVEIHMAEFDDIGGLLAEPQRVFKGWVDGQPIIIPAIGGQQAAALKIVSNARMLTRFAAGTKSDQVQRRRSDDRFRRYATATGEPTWGGKSK